MQLTQEVEAREERVPLRPEGQEGRYLAGYDHAAALAGVPGDVAVFSPFVPYGVAAPDGYQRLGEGGVSAYEMSRVPASRQVVVGNLVPPPTKPGKAL